MDESWLCEKEVKIVDGDSVEIFGIKDIFTYPNFSDLTEVDRTQQSSEIVTFFVKIINCFDDEESCYEKFELAAVHTLKEIEKHENIIQETIETSAMIKMEHQINELNSIIAEKSIEIENCKFICGKNETAN